MLVRKIVIGLFIASLAAACISKEMPTNTIPLKNTGIDSIITSFEHRLQYDVEQDAVGSISAAIFHEDQIIWSKAFGKARQENSLQADSTTIYRAASISKSITAFLLMRLVEKDILKLDEPVKKYLPEITDLQDNGLLDTQAISFRQLASHTAGLAREPGLPGAATGPIEEWEHKVLQAIPATKVNSPPGKSYAYSNIGYAILGLALSRAANKPYTKLVEELVFEPLGMKNSFFVIPEEKAQQIASGYRPHPFKGTIDAQTAKEEHSGRGYKVPNGGLYTTPNDLARFLMAQCNDSDLLTTSSKQLMQSIQTPESKDTGYGLGFYIRKNDKGIQMIEHDGGVAGYHAMMVFHPETKTGVILMRNYTLGLTHVLLEPRTVLRQLVESR